MNLTQTPHIPVLKQEVVTFFSQIKEGVIIDCTIGYGGHSLSLLQNNKNIFIIGIDKDIEAITYSKERLKNFSSRIHLIHGTFSKILQEIDFSNVKGILADFGVSSLQLDKSERGFNFFSQSLDMRMDQSQSFSAKELVNAYSQSELERIFKEYGEIKQAHKLAKAIVTYRQKTPITSNETLAKIISSVIPKKGKNHPATTAFQAIRIEVNKELHEITTLLDILEEKRPKGAIAAFISFHSLEDRLIKQRFKKWAKRCICPTDFFRCECGNNNHLGTILTKKAIIASKEELQINPRSRSAKLRVFQFKE